MRALADAAGVRPRIFRHDRTPEEAAAEVGGWLFWVGGWLVGSWAQPGGC